MARLGELRAAAGGDAAEGTHLAELKPLRAGDGPPITVRVVEYIVHTRPEGNGIEQSSEVFCLVTSQLDIDPTPLGRNR